MTEYLLLLLTVGAIVALVMGVFTFFQSIRDRRRRYWESRFPIEEDEGLTLVGNIRSKGKEDWNDRLDKSFEDMIKKTGLGWSVEQAVAWIILAGIFCAGVLLLWRWELWLVAIGLLIGMCLPLGIYLFLHARYRRKLQNQLPDTIYLLSRSLRAGLSLEQALENVADHGNQPIAGEFKRAVRQLKLGMTIPAALRVMAERIKLTDFDVLVTVVALHRNIGGNLTMLLDRVATSIRDRNLFRGHFQTATALSRITGFAVASGAPLIFLGYSLWQPDFINRFLESTTGIRMLGTAIFLEITGLIWLSYLLRGRFQ